MVDVIGPDAPPPVAPAPASDALTARRLRQTLQILLAARRRDERSTAGASPPTVDLGDDHGTP